MQRTTTILALALAVMLVLGGCSDPQPEVMAIPDIPLINRYESTSNGYGVSYPEGWSIIHSANADKLLEEVAADIEGKKKADLIKSAKEQGFVFLSDDAVADYGANISITVARSRSNPGKYLGREKKTTKALEKSFGAIEFIQPFICADFGRGGDTVLYAFRYTLGDTPQVIRQYVIFKDKQIYTITMNCPDADADHYAEIGDAIAASFHFVEPIDD